MPLLLNDIPFSFEAILINSPANSRKDVTRELVRFYISCLARIAGKVIGNIPCSSLGLICSPKMSEHEVYYSASFFLSFTSFHI